MKKYLFLIFCCVSIFVNAQFSESFFERMSPSNNKPGHFFGTEISNGALGVRFADSVNTEVQWVKLDLDGDFETYSAHLPNDYISPNERIIEVYKSGINQFIVTQDSASNNQEGIRVYKYENYTQSVGVFEFPVQLRNAYFQSYMMYGKIYVFYVEAGVGMKRLKINPATLALEENLFLGAFSYETQNTVKHYKQTHVLFQDANNMQVFASSNGNLFRINIVNNVPNAVESEDIDLTKIMGVNHSNNQIICLHSGLYNFKKYTLLSNQNLNQIVITDSLSLSGSPNPSHYWRYANNNGNKEIFISERYLKNVVGNILISEKFAKNDINPIHLEFSNDEALIFGTRNLDLDINFEGQPSIVKSLIISCGEFDKLCDFGEYFAEHEFGNYNLRAGIGNNIIGINDDNVASGDFIFSNMIFTSGLKIIGKSNGNYFGQCNSFMGLTYKPGPYTDPTIYDHNTVHRYSESVYVDRDILNYHVYAIENNIPNYVIPKGIMNWPAHGDLTLNQPFNLAPFIDLNQDGQYNPEQGEYPSFPGTRCLLNITHQHETDYQNTGSGLELHTYIYNFDCNDSIEDVVFYKTEIYNRSAITFDSLAVGVFNDFDLGGYSDDYIGTNVEKGLVYTYNGDNYDDSQSGQQGFEDSLPSIGNLFLKGAKFSANFIDDAIGISSSQTVNGFGFNDGVLDNEYKGLEFSSHFTSGGGSNQSDPSSPFQDFNYLNGKWRYGDSLFFGGTGFPGSNGSTTIPSKYVFPGESDPLFYGTNAINPGFLWSEEQNNNPSGDRRIMGSFGSTHLNAGEKVEYHYAYLAGKRVPGMGQSQIDLFAKAAHVKNAFNSNLTSCGQTFDNLTEDQITSVTKKELTSFVKLYPNPSKDLINIQIQQGNQNVAIEICDVNGRVYLTSSLKSTLNTLDISGLKNGLYFVKISLNGKTEIAKFIKN